MTSQELLAESMEPNRAVKIPGRMPESARDQGRLAGWFSFSPHLSSELAVPLFHSNQSKHFWSPRLGDMAFLAGTLHDSHLPMHAWRDHASGAAILVNKSILSDDTFALTHLTEFPGISPGGVRT